MQLMKTFYKLFSHCRISNGIFRSIIYDLQRNKYLLIPNSLSILFNNEIISFDNLQVDENEILNEYKEFLITHELIFPIIEEEFDLFPSLNLEWDYPSIITNIIIDIDDKISVDYNKILAEIESLHCYYVQFRFFCVISIEDLNTINKLTYRSLIHGIEIFAPFNTSINDQQYTTLINEFPKLRSLIIYNHNQEREFCKSNDGFGGIYFIKSNINSESHCGIISPEYFSINIETYTESLHHNTCLNRKISIDKNGEIKNCPSMVKSYGNIRDTKLIDVVNNPEFQKMWHIKKDDITKCKDCEFRYICTDCRAYIDNPDDIYSAPLKCGYDPYTGVWEEWSTNPLKQKAIEYYGMQDII